MYQAYKRKRTILYRLKRAGEGELSQLDMAELETFSTPRDFDLKGNAFRRFNFPIFSNLVHEDSPPYHKSIK